MRQFLQQEAINKESSTSIATESDVEEKNHFAENKEREMISLSPIPIKLRHFLSSNVSFRSSLEDIKTGSIVELFWKQDLMWYRGSIESVTGNTLSIKYDDGEKENIEDLSRHIWRHVSEHSSHPVPSFVVNSGLKHKFDIHMKRAKSNEKKDVVIIRGICPVNSFDFLTLRDGMWLSDSVIEAFAQKMLIKSKHEDGHRFFLLSSLYIQYIQSGMAWQKFISASSSWNSTSIQLITFCGRYM